MSGNSCCWALRCRHSPRRVGHAHFARQASCEQGATTPQSQNGNRYRLHLAPAQHPPQPTDHPHRLHAPRNMIGRELRRGLSLAAGLPLAPPFLLLLERQGCPRCLQPSAAVGVVPPPRSSYWLRRANPLADSRQTNFPLTRLSPASSHPMGEGEREGLFRLAERRGPSSPLPRGSGPEGGVAGSG